MLSTSDSEMNSPSYLALWTFSSEISLKRPSFFSFLEYVVGFGDGWNEIVFRRGLYSLYPTQSPYRSHADAIHTSHVYLEVSYMVLLLLHVALLVHLSMGQMHNISDTWCCTPPFRRPRLTIDTSGGLDSGGLASQQGTNKCII